MLEIDIEGTERMFAYASNLSDIVAFFVGRTGARNGRCWRGVLLDEAGIDF